MGKHRVPSAHPYARRALMYAALAVGAVGIALAGAGPAQAKTHHGNGAPGDPFGSSQVANTGAQVGGSFTTIRVTRSAQGGVTISHNSTTQTGGQVRTGAGDTNHHIGRGAVVNGMTTANEPGEGVSSAAGGQSGGAGSGPHSHIAVHR